MSRDPFFEKGLPENIQAERSILGAILLDNGIVAQAIDLTLKRQDFYLDSHRRIYDKMLLLTEQNSPIDLVTLSDALRTSSEFKQIGGATYVASLIDGVPRTDNIEHYVKIVLRKATARALITAGNRIQVMCLDEPDREDLDSEAQRLIFEACEMRNTTPWIQLGDASWKYLEQVERVSEQQGGSGMTGLETGLSDMDFKLLGLQRQELMVVAGRPSQGKTSLSFDLAKRVAKKQKLVAYFSIEMGHLQIGEKALSSEAQLNSWRLRGGNISRDEWARVTWVVEELRKLGVWVCDEGSIGPIQMRAKLRRLCREVGKPDLIVADYLGLMQLSPRLERYQALGLATAQCKLIAKEFDAAVMLLHQLNRDVEKRKKPEPELSDLAESGDIEKHADVVLFIYRLKAKTGEDDTTWLKIGKNRNGPTGKFPVQYFKEQNRFENAAAETD